jgi:antitoxin (DNA-binding transcriptional repressor) of toxin-antitoxin stability system
LDRKPGEKVMLTETVDIQEIQTRFTELLSLVQEGVEIILAQDDMPLARIVPVTPSTKPRVAGLHRGAIWTSDDFDEPLPEEFWVGAA